MLIFEELKNKIWIDMKKYPWRHKQTLNVQIQTLNVQMSRRRGAQGQGGASAPPTFLLG